jgi:serine protease
MCAVHLRLLGLVMLLAGVCIPSAVAAERQGRRPVAVDDATQARVIVTYRPQAALLHEHAVSRVDSPAAVARAFQRRADALASRAGRGLSVGRAIGARSHVVLARGIDSATLAARLAGDANLESVVVDRRRRALTAPNDPLYAAGPPVNIGAQTGGPVVGQWYLRAPTDLFRSSINAEGAWARTRGSADIVVAVLDTGVRYDHVDLQGRLLTGYDFISDVAVGNDGGARDADASDPGDWISAAENLSGNFKDCGEDVSSWHGTKVSGIIGAATDNGIGMAGVAPGVRILPVRVLGKCGGFDSDIAAGMLWAAGIDQPGLAGSITPARVLNMSLGGSGACTEPYIGAVQAVMARGAAVVAAAGNSAGQAVGTPANCAGVIGVTGLRHAGTKVGFSDLGPEIAIAAPGGNCVNIRTGSPCLYPILTTSNSGTTTPNAGGSIYTDSFDITVGTSFATPMVAATAALVLSARPALTPAEVKAALQTSARPFPTSGADNGPDDPTPVAQCVAPNAAEQLQCYCTTALCGAGMLDTDGAVNKVLGSLYARIAIMPATPEAGAAIQLSGAGTLIGAGRSIASWQWSLVSGGGVVTGFDGATNAANATLQPRAAGTVVVRLTVVDDQGARASADSTIIVVPGPVAQVSVTPTAPVAGSAATLSSASSQLASGRSAVAWEWTIVSGSASFSGATNAATATLLPSAAGTVVVRLTITDDLGAQASTQAAITVAAAPAAASGGGGAMSGGWLAALTLAALALRASAHGHAGAARIGARSG